MAARVRLGDGDLRVELAPAIGGSIARFDVGDAPLFRPAPADAATALDMASFPMVPFVGRIEEGRFESGGRTAELPPNFPGRPDDVHTIHGYGWLGPWELASCDLRSAHLVFEASSASPWTYRAEQWIAVEDGAMEQTLKVTHLSAGAMPAGLGAHPYLPRGPRTILRARHAAEWVTTAQGIPRRAIPHRDGVGDWWAGAPVESRLVDTAYQGREGAIEAAWPDRGVALAIEPDAALPDTVIYVPPGESFFCVEPVSHVPNAVNRPEGMRTLAPGESFAATIRYRVIRKA